MQTKVQLTSPLIEVISWQGFRRLLLDYLCLNLFLFGHVKLSIKMGKYCLKEIIAVSRLNKNRNKNIVRILLMSLFV